MKKLSINELLFCVVPLKASAGTNKKIAISMEKNKNQFLKEHVFSISTTTWQMRKCRILFT